MKHPGKFALGLLLGWVWAGAAPGNDREVILRLKDGREVRTQMHAITAKGASYVENGKTVFLARDEIKMFIFPVVDSAPPEPAGPTTRAPAATPTRTPSPPVLAKGVEIKDADLAKLMATPVSDRDLPQLLKRSDVRETFAMLQAQLISTLPDDPTADAARKKSDELYEMLASGAMDIGALTQLGQSTLKDADSATKERAESPQFEPLIAQLHRLLDAQPAAGH